ncbi:hypothetical protein [Microbacterium galbinum]|uniref:hypothetical protein n=1 Tax=Microbacterium galbinum TaxID=2851646 RepID=UPI001FFDDB95|nr:hypothetical protein [Microbacterium galbinum]MCK2030064.1 hypothetical protein [Microbacterium galbinum]
MSRPETPPIAVESAPVRWSRWWVASGALFLLTALLDAYRSLPGTLDGGVLSALSVATSAGFGLALIAAAIAGVRHPSVGLRRSAIVALGLLAVWIVAGPPLLLAVFGVSSSAPVFIDAIVKIALSGVIVAGFTRSTLPDPWRYTPAAVLAAVVLASLVEFFLLSGAVTDMNAIVLVANVLLLTRIVATGVLGAVALRAARSRADSVVVLGGRADA